eukprot:8233894-Pyramimonas_sp.AAC.1
MRAATDAVTRARCARAAGPDANADSRSMSTFGHWKPNAAATVVGAATSRCQREALPAASPFALLFSFTELRGVSRRAAAI